MTTINKKGILKRDNEYFRELNVNNIDDLDALYFYDKINYSADNKKKDRDKSINSIYEKIPKLNLDYDYIEQCKEKEFNKIDESKLTTFQKIALKFNNND